MSFFKLWKKFLMIFASKLDRTLDELDSIQNRCHRIKKGYEEAIVKLDQNRVSAEANKAKYEDMVKNAQKEIDILSAALLRADDAKDVEAVESFNRDIEIALEQLGVLTDTLQASVDQVDTLDERAQELQEEIRKADHTLLLAQTRYQSAKDLMSVSGDLTDDLRKQIEQVRKEADDMDYRYKGTKAVQVKSKPKSETARKKYASTSVSAEDRIKALREKQKGL